VILCLQATLGRHFLPRVPDRFQWIAALTDTVAWHLPVLRRVSETRALARQLPILQAAIRAGHDIAPAARQAACVDANYHARRRLRRWAERIEKGGEPAAQARALGLPRALRSALTGARGRDELAAGLHYVCSYYRSLLAHWEHVLASAAVPIVVLIWGLCIGYTVLAVFSPLYAIVDGVIAELW
jgi:type II secretory pathway component PulF